MRGTKARSTTLLMAGPTNRINPRRLQPLQAAETARGWQSSRIAMRLIKKNYIILMIHPAGEGEKKQPPSGLWKQQKALTTMLPSLRRQQSLSSLPQASCAAQLRATTCEVAVILDNSLLAIIVCQLAAPRPNCRVHREAMRIASVHQDLESSRCPVPIIAVCTALLDWMRRDDFWSKQKIQ